MDAKITHFRQQFNRSLRRYSLKECHMTVTAHGIYDIVQVCVCATVIHTILVVLFRLKEPCLPGQQWYARILRMQFYINQAIGIYFWEMTW